MSQLPRYESYKKSGVQWLGEIPSHWEVTRLKFMAKIQNGSDYKHIQTVDGYPVIGSGGQFAYATKYLYKGESVLLGRKGTIDRPLYVNCAFWTVDTMYYTEIFNTTFPKFLYYCTLTVDFWKYSTQTALPSMTQTVLSNLIFATPEYAEQKIIADYLDHHLAKVDTLIVKQETLLEKLAEQRIALISHAVTKGLNPDVKMKESKVEWLGQVPKSWKILALHYVVRLISGNSITALDFVADGNYPVYGGNGFRGYIDRYTHKGNYVLIGRQGALCGNINFATESFFATEHAIVVNPLINLNYKWLGFLLMVMNLNQYSTTAAQPGISAEVIGRLKIVLPDVKEQNQIAEHIENVLLTIDKFENKAISLKSKLKEYRSTLITQVVTGKIDVRNSKVN